MATLFTSVYSRFLNKITEDMYLELTYLDTLKDMQSLLVDAIPGFEFPRKTLEYTLFTPTIVGETIDDTSFFTAELDNEEINILAILMMNSWLQRQITSIENIRMKYSGADFKMTSQANHLNKLLALLSETQRQSIHMQRLYKRRKLENNQYVSNWSTFSEISAIDSGNTSDDKSLVNVQRLYVANGDEFVLNNN